MNQTQRIWILVALGALLASSIFAPFRAPSVIGPTKTVYAPIWNGMTEGEAMTYGAGAYEGASLDFARLGFTWAAILIITGAGLALSHRKQGQVGA